MLIYPFASRVPSLFKVLLLYVKQVDVIDKGPHPSTKHNFKKVVSVQSK